MDSLITFLQNNKHILFLEELDKFDNPINIIDDPQRLTRWIWNKEDTIRELEARYITKEKLQTLISDTRVLKERIEIFYKNSLGEEDYSRYKESVDFILEYISNRKTKKKTEEAKERKNEIFEIGKRKHTDLYKNCVILYDFNISVVNDKNEYFKNSILDDYLEKLEVNNKDIDSENSFINRNIFRAKEKYDHYQENLKKMMSLQIGKYYKKWSSLTDPEKEERILSYCDFYFKEDPGLFLFITEKIQSKEIKTKDIKWDVRSGTITNIRVEITNGEYSIKPSEQKKAKKALNRLIQIDDKHLNELILKCLLDRKSNEETRDVVEKVLKFKLNKTETEYFISRFDEIFKIVDLKLN